MFPIKKLIFFLMLLTLPARALTLEQLNSPAPPQARLGTGAVPEKIIINAKAPEGKKTAATKKADIPEGQRELTFKDLSLRKIADDIAYDLELEQDVVLGDLALLWAAAAQNSETVKYTIYKLSNPDENKPKDSVIKKIVRPIASFSTIAGTAFANNPFVASGALIGGNLMGALTSSSDEVNYKFTKVKDADMVVLIRRIDDLQKRLMLLYMDYTTKKQVSEMAAENLKIRETAAKSTSGKSREQILIADAYFRSAQSFAGKANSEYMAARNILGQLVGTKVLEEIEARELSRQTNSVSLQVR
ncbi:hypothetical protein tpqmel_0011 [Candidatus Gastranaerophilus sp. (ex Termes propinquus)]|nr:hypothetical protein tpqmel_0011 [Candidatus Gastranaerophilus sp. (ex Termes propinquus)]